MATTGKTKNLSQPTFNETVNGGTVCRKAARTGLWGSGEETNRSSRNLFLSFCRVIGDNFRPDVICHLNAVILLSKAIMQINNDSRSSLRSTFNEVALLYNEVRPCYPAELFSTLINVTNLHKNSTLLEIGAGTGQATKPLAQKGFNITAIELGASLAEVIKQQLYDYKNIQIVTGDFEEITLPPESFDLVFAATSFHWIDPVIRFSKSHTVLKNKGHLAIIHTNHISDEKGDAFFNASQSIFDRYDFTDKHQKPKLPKNEELRANDIDEHLFKLVHFQLFPVTVTYSARQFVQLLNTFSNHLAAPKEVQHAFYEEIEMLIHNSFQGKTEKHFSMSLTVAEKK